MTQASVAFLPSSTAMCLCTAAVADWMQGRYRPAVFGIAASTLVCMSIVCVPDQLTSVMHIDEILFQTCCCCFSSNGCRWCTFSIVLRLTPAFRCGLQVVWPFSGALGIPIAIDIVLRKGMVVKFVTTCVAALTVFLGPTLAIDSYYYRKPVVAGEYLRERWIRHSQCNDYVAVVCVCALYSLCRGLRMQQWF